MATLEAYDPKTDQRTSKAKLPTPVWDEGASAVNGLIYVFFLKDTFAYDPKADRWTRKARVPTWSLNSLYTASSAVDGIVYLFGGLSDDGWTTYDLAVAYDPVQDEFTAKRKMPMLCHAAACATIDGKIYHAGGASADPTVHTNAVYYSTGTNSILATNALVEATCTVPPSDAQRFFRVVEAN